MLAGLDDLARRLKRWPAALVLVGCAAPALEPLSVLIPILWSRLGYPMDVEWMEGGALLHAHRLLHGQALYGPPSQGFLPYPYPPGHFVGLAIAGGLFGLDYPIGRALSIAFLLLAAGVLAWELAQHFGRARESVAAVLLAFGAIAVGFPVVGGWYDVIRNDMMAIALPILAAGLLGDGRASQRRVIAASIALALGVYTKQTGALFAFWLCVFQLARSPRRGALLTSSTLVQGVAALALLQRFTGGWFWIYTVRNLSRHPVLPERGFEAMTILFEHAPYMLLVPIVVLVLRRAMRPRTTKWVGMFIWSFPVSLLPFMKAGGFLNNLVPVVLLAGPTTLFLLGDVHAWLERRPLGRPLRHALPFAFAAASFAAASWQLGRTPLDPNGLAITPHQQVMATRLNTWIAGLEGGVVIPNHPFLALRNGHATPQFHEMSYEDAIGGELRGLDLQGWLNRTGARWVVTTGMESAMVAGWIHQLYVRHSYAPVFVPTITGFRSGPRSLLERRAPIVRIDRRIVFDFEDGLEGWTTSGDALPQAIYGAPGHRHINTWHRSRGDAGRGQAVSPRFLIDRDHLELLIAGGDDARTRVELRVDGRVVRQSSGCKSDLMVPVVWDVMEFVGLDAQLAVIDESTGPWGHLKLDEVALFDRGG